MSGTKRIDGRGALRQPTAQVSPILASELDLLDLMGRRAARLCQRADQIDEFIAAASENQKTEASYAMHEMYAIEDAMVAMTATEPAGAVHQLVAAIGIAAFIRQNNMSADERDRKDEAIQQLLLSAIRVLLPFAGLKPSDTLVESHLTQEQAIFLNSFNAAA